MEENYENKPSELLNERKPKRGFGKGVLVGVLSTLAVVLVLGTASLGGFYLFLTRDNSSSQVLGEKEESQETDSDTNTLQSKNLLNADVLSQVSMISAYLDEYYLYDVDPEALRDGMLTGMMAALKDPYSGYFDEASLASFQDSTEGEYYGIGAAITQEISTGIVRISRPYADTPSAEAGLLPGDVLVSVGDTEVTGMDLNQVVSLIKGEEGTKVMLHIYREAQEQYLDIEVERRKVEIPTVESEMLENQIGYLKVSSFDGVTADQFITAYEALKAQGMEKVIVDLRDNGGGLVDTVETMLDYLLPEGTIFYAKDKSGTKSMEYASDAKAALDIPMAVLVNGNSASASEIFAGNIQAFGAGKLVGTTTYGKGVMQQMFYTNTEQTAAIKLTVGDYYIHSDININGSGFAPDVEVELEEEAAKQVELSKEQDNQLQKAIETLMTEEN